MTSQVNSRQNGIIVK